LTDRFQASEHGISSGIGWFELFPPLYYLLGEKTRALQEVFEKGIVFDFAILISTTHFHIRENIRKTPAWPSFTGYVGVLLF
jgi:hypothetical protein